ncbi:MAG TPA: S1/P1 nuclease [Flavisolibacter sp.]|nr:S1/P1 nuclease [Flavisolibacter sp.]
MKRLLLCSFLFVVPFYSFAWGVLGHRIVGEIASYYLTPKAKAEIQKILGTESIAISANWADFIKSDSTYNYLSSWHYINLEKGLSKEQVLSYLKADTATDVYTKLNFLVKELKKKNISPDKKQMYLKLIVHFVGDIHQPMHVGRKEDLGGNRVKLTWFNNPTNLHAIWDEALINFQQLSYTEYTAAINHTTAAQVKQWQAAPVSEWIAESYALAQPLYSELTEQNEKLGYEYNFHHIKTLNNQLLKGGVRLAGLLNNIFK